MAVKSHEGRESGLEKQWKESSRMFRGIER